MSLRLSDFGRRLRLCIWTRANSPSTNSRNISGIANVTVGDISKEIEEPKRPEFVPEAYLPVKNGELDLSAKQSQHLRWMLQKDALGQDMFLLGPPGRNRRQIVMQYLELTQREIEYVSLSRDTTEADLKQRREIQGSTAKYFDQSAVRAAIEGRILILEGIEKAERNVLPVLNNLLENREMHLEDGRFLIPAKRYDKLLKIYGENKMMEWRLEKVQEKFRIIALGLPVPRYPGNALDPPLRSRFQARHVNPKTYKELLSSVSAELGSNDTRGEQLVAVASTVSGLGLPSEESGEQQYLQIRSTDLPDFPLDSVSSAAKVMKNNEHMTVHEVISMYYPYKSFLPKESMKNLHNIFQTFKVDHETQKNYFNKVKSVNILNDGNISNAEVILDINGWEIKLNTPCGSSVPSCESNDSKRQFVDNAYHNELIAQLIQGHAVSDICIIGPKGCGKSRVAEEFGRLLGYNIETMTLYRDMTARELLQQRETTADGSGDTGWRPSALVSAAIEGRLLLLDGLHRLHPSTLSVLHRLIQDRELQLYDGTRYLRHDRYDILIENGSTVQDLNEKGVFRLHPAFRIIALAEPPAPQGVRWLSPEVLTLFNFQEMRDFTKEEEIFIISHKFKSVAKNLTPIINLAHLLRTSNDATLKSLSTSLSTRQLLRIAERMHKYPKTSAYDMVQHAFLAKFLPNIARNALENACVSCGIVSKSESGFFGTKNATKNIDCKIDNGILTIGATSTPVHSTDSLTKVPDILFYDVPQHIILLEWLLQDFLMGNHLLLVGNQGVGKNKIADRLLQLMNRPREYIQLHRDTTVHSLTVQPTVKDGMVIYEDSPLVKAVKNGHVLVVDEADKAPTHVTCILKSLVENGQMILSDGRKIISKHLLKNFSSTDDSLIVLHDDFKMIVLANRPGFPFLGNDFFAVLGDLFSCHAIDNPSIESELQLLKQYGPDVPIEIMNKIVNAFSTLRSLADQGVVTYPYSTREVVNIVKHLQEYPNDDLSNAISNVFDFDQYTTEVTDTLLEVLKSSGLPTKGVLQRQKIEKSAQVTINRKSGKDVSGPKHGKVDPKGDPHVGGNTWAGGTGGRDTAGLGGKGGPYRLDAGHTVHQLSDEEKDDIPEHVKKAAREMNRRAFEERLKEIRMSEYDAKLYNQFFSAVQPQVGALRGILSSLQARAVERNWVRHQTSGDFDDAKIIEGLTGEQAIYKRRLELPPLPGMPLNRPKRFRLLTDVSGSMYRFNSYDGRLDRSLEAVVLLMESFKGFESQIQYDIWGHSGESDSLELVSIKQPPQNEKERLNIIRTMHAHSQFCWSGDNTVPAVELSMKSIAGEVSNVETSQWDEAFLLVLSDANLSRYGVPASRLASALTSQNNIKAYTIFIGSLGDQAESLLKNLPLGRAFICMDVSTLPHILQQIFASSVMNTPSDS